MLQISDQPNSNGVSSMVRNHGGCVRSPKALARVPAATDLHVCGSAAGEDASRRSRLRPQPAQLLIVAILQRALDDLHLGGRVRVQAMRWLHEPRGESQPGSFEWCCAALDLDAEVVRRKYSTLGFEAKTAPSYRPNTASAR